MTGSLMMSLSRAVERDAGTEEVETRDYWLSTFAFLVEGLNERYIVALEQYLPQLSPLGCNVFGRQLHLDRVVDY
jgi:hypothetical protein